MRTSDFDFRLPPELIAQEPVAKRDQSRLMVLERESGRLQHLCFYNFIECLRQGDVLVLNNSRVIPARLRGANARTGGQFEMLLVEEVGFNDWWVMLRPGKRARPGTKIILRRALGSAPEVTATVLEKNEEGHCRLHFETDTDIAALLDSIGEVPLPPYITRSDTTQLKPDRLNYQTVYAQVPGSVAAPTAGLHFTPELLEKIRALGVHVCFLTLHVGIGTFAPVKAASPAEHRLHEEWFELNAGVAHTITEAKKSGRRVIGVGTTTVRVLESLAVPSGGLTSGSGKTRIFIYPPYQFKIVDALLTNFHLPRSTLLMLVSAFAAPNQLRGREMVLAAYAEAIRLRYRFFSYGDAMLLL